MQKNLISKITDHFTTQFGQSIPTFTGNRQRIEQVLINLLVNACESHTDKTGAISLETDFDKRAKRIICKVVDEGEGVSDVDISRLTDPFFTTKRDTGGTGLGLSVSAGIIEMHGGSIEITPNTDKGITVSVEFPLDA